MSRAAASTNEQQTATAFNKQAGIFDAIYSGNTIIQYKRKRVRDHAEHYLKPGSRILELNAGTGEDAIYFANKGHFVHATDVSQGMQKILLEKVLVTHLTGSITAELCSFTQLDHLKNKGPFDSIFSNFAGLNCTKELDKVLGTFSNLLKPGGVVTLVILPQFCLWETLLLFKGKFKTAFRRFFSGNGRKAHIEGVYFRCWYYDPSFIRKKLRDEFDVLEIEGLCTLVPPSYIENFAEKHPKAFKTLEGLEHKWKSIWPWRSVGDYYIISLRKKN